MTKSFEEVSKTLLKSFESFEETTFIPSGSVVLDSVIGGGIPKGKFIEISSDAGVGKTTAVLHACKVACREGHKVAYLDFEHGVNESQIEGIGLSDYLGKDFILLQPITFEDAEQIIDALVDTGITYIVIDSITAMLPGKLQDSSIGEVQPGIHARYSAIFLQKYKGVCQTSKITFIFINQVRTKMNFRGVTTQDAAGGNAQKFYMDVRLQMIKRTKLEKKMITMEGEKLVEYGSEVAVMAKKNRYNKPMIEGVMTIIYGKGVSNFAAYIKWLTAKGFIKLGGGGWYTITFNNEEEKVRGQQGLNGWVKSNISEVKRYIDENGGFLLVTENEGDED